MSFIASILFWSCASQKNDQFSITTATLPTCTNPVDDFHFRALLPEQSNIDFVHVTDPPSFDSIRGLYGAGVVVADFDQDGHQDIFFVQETGSNMLYWGEGDSSFAPAMDQTAEQLALSSEMSLATNVADYNGDGWLDLLIIGYQSLRLFQNTRDRTFLEVTEEVGLKPAEGYLSGSSWGDYDQDGDLDLFVGTYGIPTTGDEEEELIPLSSQLYRNDEGLFTDRSSELAIPVGKEGACLQAAFRDFDDDGDLDLIQVNDFGPWLGMTKIWENKGGNENQWEWQDRFPTLLLDNIVYPMGSLYRDLNGDGISDMWLSDIGKTNLLQGMGSWEWVHVSANWIQDSHDGDNDVSWSVLDLDLDGDGKMEVYINYGPHINGEVPEDLLEEIEEYVPDQPDKFWVNTAQLGQTPSFRNRSDVFPEPLIGNARGASSMDINNDGVPDLVIGNLGAPPSILLGSCTSANRLTIRLHDFTSKNYYAIGAKVTIEANNQTQTQELSAGGRGSFSGEDPTLNFGVGNATSISVVSIRWPDGTTSQHRDLCSHCSITIERTEG